MRKTQCYLHLIMHRVKEDRKSSQHKKQPDAYITNKQYEEPLEQWKSRIVGYVYHVYRVGEYILKQPRLERIFVSSVIAT